MLILKFAVFEDCIYGKRLERTFYRYCAVRQPSLCRYIFVFVLYNILRYFHLISEKRYLEKRWSFLKNVDSFQKRIAAFSEKKAGVLRLRDEDVVILTHHPEDIVSRFSGKEVRGSAYKKDKCFFETYIDNFSSVPEGTYTAYGTLGSPLTENAAESIFVYGKRKYKTRASCAAVRTAKYLFALLISVCVSLFWAIIAMYFSASSFADPAGLFASYFKKPMLVFLNFLPVFILCVGIWLIFNNLALGCTVSGVLTLILSLINYFKLMFRNDPFMFEDVALAGEAGNISAQYDIRLSRNMILCFIAVLVIAFVVRTFFDIPVRAKYVRPVLLIAVCFGVVFGSKWYMDGHFYYLNQNLECINEFSATEQYISRGFVYPFVYSINSAIDKAPDGYDAEECESLLSSYQYTDIPEDKRVNIISIMLEAYTDFDRFGVLDFSDDVYGFLRELRSESYSGYLIDDIFAAGTVTTERQFLTGLNTLPNFRKATNSYVWYLRRQGYTVEGSHPNYSWFYNRVNINEHLGFQQYLFDEQLYFDLSGQHTCGNDIVIPEIYKLYRDAALRGENYFSFSVTYQGHAPYSDSYLWFDHEYVANKGYTEAEYNILNNYFYNIDVTHRNLSAMIEKLRKDKKPVILILFGDHMPWLGNNASIYETVGIDLDLSKKESFQNYYSTPYIVWANDAAKKMCGNDFEGDGGNIGAYMLMSRVFEMAGWKGDEFNQYLTEAGKDILAVSTTGAVFDADGGFTYDPSGTLLDKVNEFKKMQFYRKKNFVYADVK